MNPIEAVRESTYCVVSNSKYVRINQENIEKMAKKLEKYFKNDEKNRVTWNDGDIHYNKDVIHEGPLTCQYIFVLDCLNFCFWPTDGLEYEHLAMGLRKKLLENSNALDSENLINITEKELITWFTPYKPPQIKERLRKIKELGTILSKYFDGKASNMVKMSKNSAVELVRLILAYLPGFRDHSVYNGEQIYFYKRAQILVADIWAAYGKKKINGIYSFHDIQLLTMFADYRVPQLLESEGVLIYSKELNDKIVSKSIIESGSEMEIEIRAATIQAVEKIYYFLIQNSLYKDIIIIELDWLLWQLGESQKEDLPPHHRTLTVFY